MAELLDGIVVDPHLVDLVDFISPHWLGTPTIKFVNLPTNEGKKVLGYLCGGGTDLETLTLPTFAERVHRLVSKGDRVPLHTLWLMYRETFGRSGGVDNEKEFETRMGGSMRRVAESPGKSIGRSSIWLILREWMLGLGMGKRKRLWIDKRESLAA